MTKGQRIAKWGNSLALRIPREAARRAGLGPGDEVTVRASAGKLTVIRKTPQYRIEDLVKQMTPESQPELIDWGPPVGKEFW